MSQTNLQNQNSLRYGSAKLLIGDDFNSLLDVGAIRGMSFEHKGESVKLEFDNTDPLVKFKDGNRASFAFQLAEIDFTTFAKTDAGLVVVSEVAGVETNITDEEITLSGMSSMSLANRNGDKSMMENIVVSDESNSAYTENVDYTLQLGADGFVQIARTSDGGIADNEIVKVDYAYTPNAHREMTFNTGGTKISKVARIINTNNAGKEFRIDMQNVTNIKPLTMPFQADSSDDVMVCDIELEGDIVKITDEQITS